MNGVLVVDKPTGCTSHDVVQRVRRVLRTRSVGHAGTLDPLATGVLVVAIGEATKLVAHLQSADKRYEVSIRLGVETDSFDVEGEVVRTCPVPELSEGQVREALQAFLGRHPQQVPALSAVKVGGQPLHRRVRRGEHVEPPSREVQLFDAHLDELGPDRLQLSLHCGKGYFVRSLARDLSAALGTCGHVIGLRRTTSGAFDLSQAVELDDLTPELAEARLVSLPEACAGLLNVQLTTDGVDDARHGRAIAADRVIGTDWEAAAPDEALALLSEDGELIALGRRVERAVRVTRGFVSDH